MLEEKNDNLQDADGNVVNDSLETTAAENQEITTFSLNTIILSMRKETNSTPKIRILQKNSIIIFH